MARLRPATPLSVLLLAAFAMLLISVLSVPVTKLIPLGNFKDVTFGVFGFCRADGSCSPIGIGYDTGMSAPYVAPRPYSLADCPARKTARQ